MVTSSKMDHKGPRGGMCFRENIFLEFLVLPVVHVTYAWRLTRHKDGQRSDEVAIGALNGTIKRAVFFPWRNTFKEKAQ